MFRSLLRALPLSLVVMSACADDQLVIPTDDAGAPLFAISDGARGGTPEFFWLAPTVAQSPATTGVPDDSALPELQVEICLLAPEGGCAGSPIQQMDAGTLPMPSRLKYNASREAYEVTWLSGASQAQVGKEYRVTVRRQGSALGFVDVAIVQTPKQVSGVNTSLYTGLVKGQQFPINFRIERPIARNYVKVNEVESNQGVPGDWVELYNTSDTPFDLGGYIFRDDNDSRGYAIPAGTMIPAKGFLVLDEAQFDFGLGATDNARLFAPDGVTLVDNHAWAGGHAVTTFGRCPDGTGAFATTSIVTKGAANDCAPLIQINEVESSGGTPGDWIELYNANTAPVDLGGYIVRDDNDSRGYTIPTGTTIAAGGFLVIEEAQLGFGLGAADAARLFRPNGSTLVDSFSWTSHASTTYGRCPDGTGSFLTTLAPTKGTANACAAATTTVKINEVESDGGTPGDWVELINTGAEAVDLSGYVFRDNDDTEQRVFPSGTIIAAGGYLILEGSTFIPGLGGNDAARLFAPGGVTLVDSYSWTSHAATTYGRCPNGTGAFVTMTSSTKGAANDCGITVRINEVESSGGVPGDWVELYNAGPTPADLSGYVFRDNNDAANYVLPSGSVIAPGGYLVLNEAQFGFGLGASDAARLFAPNGTTLVDSYTWATHAATTYGRCPNGVGAFTTTVSVTKGAANDCGNPAAGIVFNEIESNGGTPGDWVELLNIGNTPVDLSGYYFRDNVDTRTFQLPAGTIVAPGAFLVIEEAQFGFGLGTPDAARLFAPDGVTLVTSYAWTPHAATTYGRCPDGTGEFVTTTSSTKGAPNDCSAPVRINEVESSGGIPGDWVELINNGTTPIDLGGYVFRDNNDAASYTIPANTLVPAGGYLVLDESQFGFGLGAGDAARLFAPGGTNLVDSYTWTSHASTTYGRCPNGTGAFTTTTTPTKGTVNACPGDLVVAPWPGDATIFNADPGGALFGGNMSGLSYVGSGTAAPGVLWAARNGPGAVFRLLWNGSVYAPDQANDWAAGKLLRYPDGTGDVDAEGLVAVGDAIYVASERNNAASGTSRNSVLRYDPAAAGSTLTAVREWNLTADLPTTGANLGLEAITWIPDSYLLARGFIDESTGLAYNPANYPNHGTGLFFVALEATGNIYAYALNEATGGFNRIATIVSGYVGVMDLAWDPELQQLWAICDNGCLGRSAILGVDTTPASATQGTFVVVVRYERPTGMPNLNNEGFAVARQAECVGDRKPAFWADDSETSGVAIRRGTVSCTVP